MLTTSMPTTTIFLNLSQHALTEAQQSAALNLYNAKVVSFKEAFASNPELISNLESSPDNAYDLSKVVKELISEIDSFYTDQVELESITQDSKMVMVVHLPIGSPAFNFELARRIGSNPYYHYSHLLFVFSHTERISVEKDGKKVSEFRFSHFIEM